QPAAPSVDERLATFGFAGTSASATAPTQTASTASTATASMDPSQVERERSRQIWAEARLSKLMAVQPVVIATGPQRRGGSAGLAAVGGEAQIGQLVVRGSLAP